MKKAYTLDEIHEILCAEFKTFVLVADFDEVEENGELCKNKIFTSRQGNLACVIGLLGECKRDYQKQRDEVEMEDL